MKIAAFFQVNGRLFLTLIQQFQVFQRVFILEAAECFECSKSEAIFGKANMKMNSQGAEVWCFKLHISLKALKERLS